MSACSSVPAFHPSKPIEEARNFEEALDICAGYHIQGQTAGNGKPVPDKVVVLTPWLRCFEDTLRKIPDSQFNVTFTHFFRSLNARHDGVPDPTANVIDWPAMNFVVARMIEHIKTPGLAYSDVEKTTLQRQLPPLAFYLAESGAFGKQPRKMGSFADQDLKRMREYVLRTEQVGDKKREVALGNEEKHFCERWRDFRDEVQSIEDLGQYQRVLEEQTYAEFESTSDVQMREKIKMRYSESKKDALDKMQKLDSDWRVLRVKKPGFHPLVCLE